jgi:hypothetical protein
VQCSGGAQHKKPAQVRCCRLGAPAKGGHKGKCRTLNLGTVTIGAHGSHGLEYSEFGYCNYRTLNLDLF